MTPYWLSRRLSPATEMARSVLERTPGAALGQHIGLRYGRHVEDRAHALANFHVPRALAAGDVDTRCFRSAGACNSESGKFLSDEIRDLIRRISLANRLLTALPLGVQRSAATSKVRRNMPDPAPVVLLGRLAVARAWQGKGVGADLLRGAVLRTLAAADSIGVRAILVHAISDGAKTFYERHGFRPSPLEPMTLMITVKEAKRNDQRLESHDTRWVFRLVFRFNFSGLTGTFGR
jgi:GNAT superfamily N-acetyltransferase